MHTIPELVAHANAAGLVTRREVLDGMVSVRRQARSGRSCAILVRDRPVGVVKEPSSHAVDAGIDRERRALRCLGDVDLGPRLLPRQPGDALWMGAVRGVDLLHTTGTAPELAELCESWGVGVAQLHRLPTGQPAAAAPRPWLLDADRRDRAAARVPRGSGEEVVLDTIEHDPWLRLAARQVDARWTERHWIHGDLRPVNVVAERLAPVRVRFVNFEQSGLADPAWDVATAIDGIAWLAERWGTSAGCLSDYFLRGYRRAGGPAALYPAIQAVRALASAWQLAELGARGEGTCGPGVSGWLDRARVLARRAALPLSGQ